jgi:hypothetical protein
MIESWVRQKRIADDSEKLKESLYWARTIVADGEDPVPIAVALFQTGRTRLLEDCFGSHLDNIIGGIGHLSDTLESSIKRLSDTITETDHTKEINKALNQLKSEVEIFRDRLS